MCTTIDFLAIVIESLQVYSSIRREALFIVYNRLFAYSTMGTFILTIYARKLRETISAVMLTAVNVTN